MPFINAASFGENEMDSGVQRVRVVEAGPAHIQGSQTNSVAQNQVIQTKKSIVHDKHVAGKKSVGEDAGSNKKRGDVENKSVVEGGKSSDVVSTSAKKIRSAKSTLDAQTKAGPGTKQHNTSINEKAQKPNSDSSVERSVKRKRDGETEEDHEAAINSGREGSSQGPVKNAGNKAPARKIARGSGSEDVHSKQLSSSPTASSDAVAPAVKKNGNFLMDIVNGLQNNNSTQIRPEHYAALAPAVKQASNADRDLTDEELAECRAKSEEMRKSCLGSWSWPDRFPKGFVFGVCAYASCRKKVEEDMEYSRGYCKKHENQGWLPWAALRQLQKEIAEGKQRVAERDISIQRMQAATSTSRPASSKSSKPKSSRGKKAVSKYAPPGDLRPATQQMKTRAPASATKPNSQSHLRNSMNAELIAASKVAQRPQGIKRRRESLEEEVADASEDDFIKPVVMRKLKVVHVSSDDEEEVAAPTKQPETVRSKPVDEDEDDFIHPVAPRKHTVVYSDSEEEVAAPVKKTEAVQSKSVEATKPRVALQEVPRQLKSGPGNKRKATDEIEKTSPAKKIKETEKAAVPAVDSSATRPTSSASAKVSATKEPISSAVKSSTASSSRVQSSRVPAVQQSTSIPLALQFTGPRKRVEKKTRTAVQSTGRTSPKVNSSQAAPTPVQQLTKARKRSEMSQSSTNNSTKAEAVPQQTAASTKARRVQEEEDEMELTKDDIDHESKPAQEMLWAVLEKQKNPTSQSAVLNYMDCAEKYAEHCMEMKLKRGTR